MNKTKTVYWIFTALLAAFTLLTSISQIAKFKSSVDVMTILGFPLYMLPFLGFAKLLGVVGLFITRSQRIVEWSYAGILFDFLGAAYSMIAIGGTIDKWGFMALPILLWALSFIFYNKLLVVEHAHVDIHGN
jgi:uncharacterized membrane protein YedE/YeeE